MEAASGESQSRLAKEVPAQVKDPDLLKERRLAVIEAAVKLFTAQGFHKTTTRRIAEEAGMGVGSLYEYVRSKEDILFLVTDHIHGQVEKRLKATLEQYRTNARTDDARAALVSAIAAYLAVCDDLTDDILLIYQESKSLPPASRRSMLEREVRIGAIFEEIINQGVKEGAFRADPGTVSMAAEDIVVLGHMWTFRRWRLAKRYDLVEYTRLQTGLILRGLDGRGDGSREAAPREPVAPLCFPDPPDPMDPTEQDVHVGEAFGLESLLDSMRKF